MKIVGFLVLFASFCLPATAWWCEGMLSLDWSPYAFQTRLTLVEISIVPLSPAGHVLTVQVAMKSMSSSTLTAAQALADVVNQWYPDSPDLLTAACWADDLKAQVSHGTHPLFRGFVRPGKTYTETPHRRYVDF
jgi:hypothetical protein